MTGDAPLRGRRDEPAELDALVGRARAGRSGALVVSGEAGVGKTALLEHAAARADDDDVEYHLGKVFTKLGIRGRAGLRTALADLDRAAPGAGEPADGTGGGVLAAPAGS
ncbi:ATP-binding protein [Actinomadura sp. LOL_016]|uniref:ATP-binding protein n=1 Tax=unclassified Actinomadura TaxID=2626254 RepID=UPI003A80BF62